MPLWIVAALVVIGAAFVFCAVNLAIVVAGAARRRSRGTTTTGVVVHVAERGESAGEGVVTVYIPTLEFRDAGGTARRFQSRVPVPECPRPGGTLTVWYDPDDPATPPEVDVPRIRGAVALYSVALVLCAGLAAFFVWFSTVSHS